MSARAMQMTRGRIGRLVAAASFSALMVVTAVVPAQAATPPVFPDNIVIFPERDFLSLEGYQEKVGQQATITVLRGGVVSGKATGTVSAGDPALEVNHPGGVCWNEEIAPGIKVTPNIKPGDNVRVQFRDGTTLTGTDSARTQDVRVIDRAAVAGDGFEKVGSNQLIVRGRIGANVNPNFVEQRIINPAMKDTDIGRRDIRAPERPGPYTSSLVFNPATGTTAKSFTATYTFNTDADTTAAEATQMRNLAAEGQLRVLAWMAEDADANRQGLTIYEYAEVGGPGMGGCPNGPEQTAPLAPSDVTATAGDASATANWSAAKTIPDGSPITGYRVSAIDTANNAETSASFGSNATSGTVPNLINGREYRIEVRATSAAGPGQVAAAANTVTPASAPLPAKPNAPTIGAAADGSTTNTTAAGAQIVDAQAAWSAVEQPAGVSVDGWRVTAYQVNADGSTGARVKSVFVDEPLDPADNSRTRNVSFTNASTGNSLIPSGTQVRFKVQAIDADGTLSAASGESNAVTAQ